jgi:hypothetical protein
VIDELKFLVQGGFQVLQASLGEKIASMLGGGKATPSVETLNGSIHDEIKQKLFEIG